MLSFSFFKKSRPFYRIFIFMLVIILCFDFICKPKRVDAAATSTLLTVGAIVGIIGTIASIGFGTYQVATDAYDRWAAKNGETDDFQTYFNKNITVDGSGNYVISDAGMVTINAMQEELKESDTYTYGYLPGSKNLGNEGFEMKSAFDVCFSLIQGNPGSLFYIAGHSVQSHPTLGSKNCLQVNILSVPYAGVGNMGALSITDEFLFIVPTSVVYYSEDWEFTSEYRTVYIYDDYDVQGMFYYDSSGERHEFLDASEVLLDFDVTDVAVSGSTNIQGYTYRTRRAFSQLLLNYGLDRLYSDYPGGFPVFNSYAALKKGMDDCTQVEYMPGYSGQPITKNTVTQQEINDYSTTYNYYYGDSSGGSGSGGSGSGGGSSGNWIDTIVNGIGAFFDGALQIIGKIIEALGKFMTLIADAFSDLSEVMPTGFINFLSQLFPFIPEEWVTAATLFLSLALLGVFIRIFGK